jgi:protein-L-isoaspartate O-methyltransferase
MNELQKLIYNNGERLVPYASHGDNELIRHRSSYAFFHAVISSDLQTNMKLDGQLSIADLGFGSGYGCALLSSLPSSHVTGIDIGPECELFAQKYYGRPNVDYLIKDLEKFIPEADFYDYVVSRGVLEHVPDGLGLVKLIKFNQRIMIDVPYDEEPGNEHHVLTGIKEDSFAALENFEFFYEDLNGRIFDAGSKPKKANMIMVVISAPTLPKIGTLFKFPIEPIQNIDLEVLSGIKAIGRCNYFDTADELLSAVEGIVRHTEVVVDIGCGIVPMNYFRPKLHLMVEPWKEYSDILAYRHAGDKSVIIIRAGALETLCQFADNSVDSIFLLDVIEHLEKEAGSQVIIESERVAREQIVIFTPLGFMPQHVESNQPDGWGLSGSTMQEHRSGWEPEDFKASWSFYICESFHGFDYRGERLSKPFGAFFAVHNFDSKQNQHPKIISDIRRPLPSEIEVKKLTLENDQKLASAHEEYERKLAICLEECERQRAIADECRNETQKLFQTRGLRLIRRIRKILGITDVR